MKCLQVPYFVQSVQECLIILTEIRGILPTCLISICRLTVQEMYHARSAAIPDLNLVLMLSLMVESGVCRGCRGKDNARKNIYDFVAKNEASRGLLAERPALDYCGRPMEMDLPDKPYKCQSCGRRYSQLSSLMQHQEYNPRCNNRSNQLPLTFRGYY